MNIFILDSNIRKCAQYHCDVHNIKMILESAQLLCSAIWMTGSPAPYKLTHKNHPCSKWARESLDNWLWLKELALELCSEYTRRYSKIHKSEGVINSLKTPNIESKGLTDFPLAMPEQYKSKNPVKSYRDYYIHEKKDIAKWNKLNNVPEWFKKEMTTCQ
jgi:hypothetical protein